MQESFFVFDSHSRNSNGLLTPDGFASVAKFDSFIALEHFIVGLANSFNAVQFEATGVCKRNVAATTWRNKTGNHCSINIPTLKEVSAKRKHAHDERTYADPDPDLQTPTSTIYQKKETTQCANIKSVAPQPRPSVSQLPHTTTTDTCRSADALLSMESLPNYFHDLFSNFLRIYMCRLSTVVVQPLCDGIRITE